MCKKRANDELMNNLDIWKPFLPTIRQPNKFGVIFQLSLMEIKAHKLFYQVPHKGENIHAFSYQTRF
jgi:hypothetical protein